MTTPGARQRLHDRRITIAGYGRPDGLFDIEADLEDVKTYAFSNHDRGTVSPGEAVHRMRARLTVDPDLRIVEAHASTEAGPWVACPSGADSFANLAGLIIRPGFLRAATDRIAGTAGCTHLRELLQQIATVALQTIGPLRTTAPDPAARPPLLDTCRAYAANGAVVARRWPAWATPEAAAD